MRAVIQRVRRASVTIEGKLFSRIETGLLVLLGIEEADNNEDAEWLTGKIMNMRLFPDENQKMNKDLTEIQGEVLVVSQFTLHASTKKGNRPSFIRAARPETAIPLYESFLGEIEKLTGKKPKSGSFGARMDVELINDGPVTIIIDTKNRE